MVNFGDQRFLECSTPKFRLKDPGGSFYRRFAKRAFDITVVILAAPIVVPVILILSLLIFLDDRASPFYSQDRVGLNGRCFRFWKLRTMVPDAKAKLEAYLDGNPQARAEWEETQKLKSDPRITPLGQFLRKTSFDELPQLWNVLIGDMSLVGPRPMMPEQVKLYPGVAYFRLRPGITGFWQISDRNDSAFATRAIHDTAYAKSLTLATDMSVLFRTVRVVVRGTGY